MELNGVGVACEEDTTEAMTECFIEEFMRLGYNAKQILAMFRNPHYIGMNMVVQNRGEQFVRDRIAEIFLRWGKPVAWPALVLGSTRVARVESGVAPDSSADHFTVQQMVREGFRRDAENCTPEACAPQEVEHHATLTDPTGAPIPILNP